MLPLLVLLCHCQIVLAWDNGLARKPVRKTIPGFPQPHPHGSTPAPLFRAVTLAAPIACAPALLPPPLLLRYCVLHGKSCGRINRCNVTAQVMGWATWNAFHRHFTEQVFYDAADLMAKNGMQAAGYEYINVVCCPAG
jgi:hypothetical protein